MKILQPPNVQNTVKIMQPPNFENIVKLLQPPKFSAVWSHSQLSTPNDIQRLIAVSLTPNISAPIPHYRHSHEIQNGLNVPKSAQLSKER